MFWRLVWKSFRLNPRRKALAVLTVALGASLVTAMLNVMLDVGDRVNQELKAYGANLQVLPPAALVPVTEEEFDPPADGEYLAEADLPKIKAIFWGHNILGFVPYLEGSALAAGDRRVKVAGAWFDRELVVPTGERLRTGLKQMKPWWSVQGKWVDDDGELRQAMVGANVAATVGLRPGDELELAFSRGGEDGLRPVPVRLVVRGILESGDADDDRIFVPLALAQEVWGLRGKVSRVEVSALTTPDNDLARKAEADPESLTPKEFETWYCTAYVSAVAYQIEEALPGVKAEPIRRVAQSEGVILGKIRYLVLLLTVAALASSALGVAGLMSNQVLERGLEIALLKAIGAGDGAVALLFLVEAGIAGLAGGILGYGAGLGLAWIIGRRVFGAPLALKVPVIPLVLLMAVGVTLAGSFSAVRASARLRPAEVPPGGR